MNTKPLRRIQSERLAIARKKQHDYAGKFDVISVTGIEGVSTRIFDKASRVLSLVLGKKKPRVNESLRDALLDLGNYADFGVAIIDGKWPEVSNRGK